MLCTTSGFVLGELYRNASIARDIIFIHLMTVFFKLFNGYSYQWHLTSLNDFRCLFNFMLYLQGNFHSKRQTKRLLRFLFYRTPADSAP